MKYVFIINPKAGERDLKAEITKAVKALPEAADCELYVTKGPRDATAYVKAWREANPASRCASSPAAATGR